MVDLVIEGVDEVVMARLEDAARRRGISLAHLVRDALPLLAADPREAWLDELRAARRLPGTLPATDTVALIHAEREARLARILGEDDEEAWARAYRAAL